MSIPILIERRDQHGQWTPWAQFAGDIQEAHDDITRGNTDAGYMRYRLRINHPRLYTEALPSIQRIPS